MELAPCPWLGFGRAMNWWHLCAFCAPFVFKWDRLQHLHYTYPTPLCQVWGGTGAWGTERLSLKFPVHKIEWNGTQETEPKKIHLRSFPYILTWCGWQVPGMLVPNWNKTKGSSQRDWVYCAWERDVNYCSQRVEEQTYFPHIAAPIYPISHVPTVWYCHLSIKR